MHKFRNFISARGIIFPTTNKLLESRKKLRPVIIPVLDEKGVSVDYKELVKITTTDIFKVVAEQGRLGSFEPMEGDSYSVFFKGGCDGEGRY